MNSKIQMSGPTYIFGYCILGAAIDVFLSGMLQSINLFVLLFWTFTFTWLGFFLVSFLFFPVKFKKFNNSFKLIFLLNISTLVSWVGLFVGLKWTEPSILVAILFGLSPIVSFLIEIYNKNPVGMKSVVISVLLTFIVSVLMILAVKGQRSNPFDSNILFVLVLGLVCIVTSTGMAVGTYMAKSLSKREFNAVNVQSFRFPLLICVCYLLLPNEGALATTQSNFWMYLPFIVILGNILPLWMLQKGLELSSPLSTNIIVNISPCITLLLEFFDPSIEYNHMKLFVLIMLLVVILIANDDANKFIISKIRGRSAGFTG
jgi:drug/metabolite transporter (DMT)-like permease